MKMLNFLRSKKTDKSYCIGVDVRIHFGIGQANINQMFENRWCYISLGRCYFQLNDNSKNKKHLTFVYE